MDLLLKIIYNIHIFVGFVPVKNKNCSVAAEELENVESSEIGCMDLRPPELVDV